MFNKTRISFFIIFQKRYNKSVLLTKNGYLLSRETHFLSFDLLYYIVFEV